MLNEETAENMYSEDNNAQLRHINLDINLDINIDIMQRKENYVHGRKKCKPAESPRVRDEVRLDMKSHVILKQQQQ